MSIIILRLLLNKLPFQNIKLNNVRLSFPSLFREKKFAPTDAKGAYSATFILDNRGKEDSVEQIIEGLKQDITTLQGEVTGVENIGKRDFARVTDPKLTGATYVHIAFSAAAEVPAHLKERLRLNSSVYRTFVEAV